MWPMVKKQLHHTKAMRALQPELKRIKQATKGNRQQESIMVMELYKERGLNPFAPIGLLILQIPILIALYSGINKIVNNPQTLIDFAYPFVQNLSWMEHLKNNIGQFDNTLFGLVDLGRSAIGKNGGIYWPAMAIVIGASVVQYFQSKQLMPNDDKARNLRSILKAAGDGKQADQSEVSAAVGRSTRYLIPAMIFIFTVNIASALSLYFLATGVVALIQQNNVLKQDETELTATNKKGKPIIEGEIIESSKKQNPKKSKKKRKR
jgi:YidC/Oxa1 family membrane protein insertase